MYNNVTTMYNVMDNTWLRTILLSTILSSTMTKDVTILSKVPTPNLKESLRYKRTKSEVCPEHAESCY
jgi:hypothetical protein